ncbi:prepilin-type N-terminal cleavage/methylation domain-containing protein [Agaribacter marinus]|uniref:Prepilin-type N-terminal cleavage/methylation domain-containing protein n=1 Tax=Agaribacter marinus TaxID=1431249 RepID=A0AA37SWC3_9ALTE|nr:prepilin-type N-terminal cleavage/methylation domain-containing protein [Agaribacter marinus]GLR70873.1 hypothetical protein GCM10007852_17810 [Agaribacter marinus]
MQMWDMYRKYSVFNTCGFTIIEVLVVLVIVGLISAVVAPNVFSMLNSANKTSMERELRGAIMSLPLNAKLSQTEVEVISARTLSEYSTAELSEFSGLTFLFEPQLRVNSNGFCHNSTLEVFEGRTLLSTYEIQAPYCSLRIVD